MPAFHGELWVVESLNVVPYSRTAESALSPQLVHVLDRRQQSVDEDRAGSVENLAILGHYYMPRSLRQRSLLSSLLSE